MLPIPSLVSAPLALALGAAVLAPPAAAQDAPEVVLSGEIRVRSELDARADSGADHATLLRTRLGVGIALSPHARLFAQVQDARAFGEELGTLDASADQIDLHQGWLELSDSLGGREWSARIGRQEIVFGDERLVGALGWANTGRAFDGIRVRTGALNLFAASIRELDRVAAPGVDPRQNEGRDRDHAFGGIYLDARIGDAYLLHDRNAAGGMRTDVDRTTVGARVDRRPARGFGFEAEAAYQFGGQWTVDPAVEQDVSAWFATGRAGWVSPGALRAARVGIDWLSGDDDAADGDYTVFNTLYGTNHKFYGAMDFFTDIPAHTGGRGLVDALASVTVAPRPTLPVEATLHRFWLAEEAPGGRDLGWELDLTVPFAAVPGVRALAGYSVFRTGGAAPAAGLPDEGAWLHWGFVQLTAGF